MAWNYWFATGSGMAALSIALGAFARHALKARLDSYSLEVFEIGVRFQMYAAFGLLAIAFLCSKFDTSLVHVSGYLMFFGAIVFAGAMYGIALLGLKWLGAIAPIGGLGMIVAWLLLVYCCVKG